MRIICFLLVLSITPALAQGILDVRLDSTYSGLSFKQVLVKVESNHLYKFYYIPEWFDPIQPPARVNNTTFRNFLNEALTGHDISYAAMHGYVLYFYKDPSERKKIDFLLDSARQLNKRVSKITFGSASKITNVVSVTGKVLNAKDNYPLQGALIQVVDLNSGTSTNLQGEFDLLISGGNHIIEVSSLGFDTKVINLEAFESGNLDISLDEQAKLLDDVVVSDQATRNQKSNTGLYKISMADVKKMPSFMGEVDIVRQVQVLPGVTSAGEVSSGFNVRGGSADQNLILFDGIPIFNYSHVFGLFSAFNADAIKSANFYKGGIPAEFGGRVSSVLDITGKEADFKKWQGGAGIGLITSSISGGGPLVKDKTSLSISARSSYSDWMLKAFAPSYQQVQNSSVSFHDITAKLSHKIGMNDKLSFSFYTSKDKFGLPSDTTFSWKNKLGSVRYDHIFNTKVAISAMAGMGQYAYEVTDKDPSTAYTMEYSITYPVFNLDLVVQLPKHKVSIGLNNILYDMSPGSIFPDSEESNIDRKAVQKSLSMENSVYLSDAIDFTDRFHLDLGIRASVFSIIGPSDVYVYGNGLPLNSSTRVDTIQFAKGEVIKRYAGIEPRLSMRYSTGSNSSIKFGYNRIFQYMHLISNSVAVTPIDIWQPSNTAIKPQIGDQISLGYYQNLKEGTYETSIEGFYKSIDNVLDFKDGVDLVLNPAIETSVIRSLSKSYGIEFTLNKVKSSFLYSINYTYSRSLRRTTGRFEEEIINDGKYFPSNFDQPHVVNANFKYAPSRRFAITGNFTYHTGRATTVPISYSVVENVPIVNYSQRNGFRVPDYHRLDLAFVLEGDHRKKKLWQGTWALSFYNVYARRNVYAVFYSPNAEGIQSAYRMAIIGAVIPSLTYRIKF